MIRLNTLKQRQNGCHFTDDFFKGMFLNEKVWILIKISLNFVPKGSINKILALVQIMVWHLPVRSHYLNQCWLVYWCIKVSLCLDELTLLPLGGCDINFKSIIFELVTQTSIFGPHCEMVLRWVPQNLTNQKSTMVQVMAWCHQATSHDLRQCGFRSMLPYDVTRPQLVNSRSAVVSRKITKSSLNSITCSD